MATFVRADTHHLEGDRSEPVKPSSSTSSESPSLESALTEPPLTNQVPLGSGIVFIPPPGEPIPVQSADGGARNRQCFNTVDSATVEGDRPQLAALVPPSQMGLTASGRPTLWLYQAIPSIRQILLSVREAESLLFHSQTTIEVTPDRTWLGLQIAPEGPPLKPEIAYEWSVLAICGDRPGPKDPSLSAWVRLVVPQPSSSTIEATPLALLQQYGQQGLWYDLVTTLMQAQQSPPEQELLADTWSDLLDYAGLSSIARDPFAPSIRAGN